MKLSHAIILIALLTSQFASLAFGSAIVNGLCQFDKSYDKGEVEEGPGVHQ